MTSGFKTLVILAAVVALASGSVSKGHLSPLMVAPKKKPITLPKRKAA